MTRRGTAARSEIEPAEPAEPASRAAAKELPAAQRGQQVTIQLGAEDLRRMTRLGMVGRGPLTDAVLSLAQIGIDALSTMASPANRGIRADGEPVKPDRAGVLFALETGLSAIRSQDRKGRPVLHVQAAGSGALGSTWPVRRGCSPGVVCTLIDESGTVIASGLARSDGTVAPALLAHAGEFESFSAALAAALAAEPTLRASSSLRGRSHTIALRRVGT